MPTRTDLLAPPPPPGVVAGPAAPPDPGGVTGGPAPVISGVAGGPPPPAPPSPSPPDPAPASPAGLRPPPCRPQRAGPGLPRRPRRAHPAPAPPSAGSCIRPRPRRQTETGPSAPSAGIRLPPRSPERAVRCSADRRCPARPTCPRPTLTRPHRRGRATTVPPTAPGEVGAAGRLALDEAVSLARQHAFTTNAGLAFYPDGDSIRSFAHAIHPTDGFVTLDLHGSPHGFQIDNRVLSPEQFAAALRSLEADGMISLADGVGIKLLSCDTAAGGPDSVAARLARALGVEVIAPDTAVWTTPDGTEIVASAVLDHGIWIPKHPPDGAWHHFDPHGTETLLDDLPVADQTDAETRSRSHGETEQPRAPDEPGTAEPAAELFQNRFPRSPCQRTRCG